MKVSMQVLGTMGMNVQFCIFEQCENLQKKYATSFYGSTISKKLIPTGIKLHLIVEHSSTSSLLLPPSILKDFNPCNSTFIVQKILSTTTSVNDVRGGKIQYCFLYVRTCELGLRLSHYLHLC